MMAPGTPPETAVLFFLRGLYVDRTLDSFNIYVMFRTLYHAANPELRQRNPCRSMNKLIISSADKSSSSSSSNPVAAAPLDAELKLDNRQVTGEGLI